LVHHRQPDRRGPHDRGALHPRAALHPEGRVPLRLAAAPAVPRRPAPSPVERPVARGPALAILECGLIARGLVVADAAMKRAEVELVASRVVSSGRHLTILAGAVEPVVEA